jgi:hypothetical protein
MAKTYFVGSNNQVKRIDDHTFSAPNGIQLYPVGTPDTTWRDVMTHPTNEDKVIIVGTSVDVGPGTYVNSSIQLSNDGGVTWFTPGGNWIQKSETFHEVWWCEDGQTIWAINSFGIVVRSTDGGLNFNSTDADIGLNFPGDISWTSAIHALDELTAVVAGSPSGSLSELSCYVWLTIDGGTNWNILNSGTSLYNPIIDPITSQPYGFTGASNGVWINDNGQKIVVAAGYGQWLSTDGGISFQAVAVDMHRSGQHLTWFPTYDINPPTYRHVGGPVISVVESLTAGLSWTNERSYEIGGGGFGIVPPTNQPTAIIGAHFYETEKGYYSVNDQLFSTDDGAVTGTPIDSITNGIIQAVWTGETIQQEPTLYTLVDACENEPFYNDAGIIVVFEYNQICDAGFCPLDLQSVIITSFDDGDLYNGAGCYVLTEITSYPTNAYVTRNYEDTFNQNSNITTVDAIEQCCPISPCYLLTDCAGNEDPIYTGTDLSAHIGEVITLADEDNHEIATCWQVSLSDQECFDVPEVVVYKCYEDCEHCLPEPTPIRKPTNRQVLPNYETGNCDPELVEKAFCAHSDMWHKIVRERRFMIKQCCPKDEDKINIEYYKIKSKLLESTNPAPDPCNPLCYEYEATVQPTFSAVTTFVDCFGTEQTIVTLVGTEPQVIVFCALNTTTPTITITDSNDNEIGTFPIPPTEECLDPVVPPIPPIPSPWRSEACVFGFMDGVRWVNEKPEGPVTAHTITSLIINGTEYITPGNEYDYDLEPTNWIPAANLFGETYTNQVDGMNALFTLLGVDNLVQVQVVTNDVWAITANHVGGYYLILANTVDTISWTITDNTGFIKTNTWDNGVASVEIDEGSSGNQPTTADEGYEWATCINADNEVFIVTDGPEVIEPPFPPTPCCIEMQWTADDPNADNLFPLGISSFYLEGYSNGKPYYKTNIQGKFRTPYGSAWLWYDLSTNLWIISTSFGIPSTSLARLNSQEFCATNFDIPTNSVTEPWVLPAESSFTGIVTVDCQLEQNLVSIQPFQWHMYRRDDTELSVVQIDQAPGTHNGKRAWQFEEVGPYSTGIPGLLIWEISYNGVDKYELRSISAIGDPFGGGLLVAQSANTNEFTITRTLSIIDDPVLGWEVVVVFPYTFSNFYLKPCFP